MLLTPFYARSDRDEQRPQIHEYRDADYMQLFDADLQKNRLKASADQAWFEANKLDEKAYPVLRQPIHQGYYLATAELTCDSRNRAPVDPKRVKEAWLTVTAYAEDFDVEGVNPIHAKQLLQASLIQAKEQGKAYPMRPLATQDTQGRTHTILSGFLPVADIVNRESDEKLQTDDQLNESARQLAVTFASTDFSSQTDQVLWNGTHVHSRLAALMQLLDENLAIGVLNDDLAYTAGMKPDSAASVDLDEWKNWLANGYFYQLPEATQSRHLNDEQQQFKIRRGQLMAHMPATPPAGVTQAYRDAYGVLRQAVITETLPGLTPRRLTFNLRQHFTPERISGYTSPWLVYLSKLSSLLADFRSEMARPANMLGELSQLRHSIDRFSNRLAATISATQALDAQFRPLHKYRGKNLLQWYLSDRNDAQQPLNEQLPGGQKLIVSGHWVAQGPDLIRRRWLMLITSFTHEWQASKQASALQRDDEQLYRIRIFASITGAHGCEYLVHSQLGSPFYIASFYETRLMPTFPIKMPSLKDLKKAVRGPGLIMPSDLANEVNKLKFPDGKVEQSGSGSSGRWIYVFSIPIVTICAMILLMLMINILNFIFRWIPYAILRIPFPK